MAREIPSTEPTEFVQGETVKWTKTFSDFPTSEAWAIVYELRGESTEAVTGSIAGDEYEFELTASETAAMTIGDYWWQSWAEKGAEKYVIASGRMTLKSDLGEEAAGYDGRSNAKIILDALNALAEGKATKDQRDVMVGDRRIVRLAPQELMDWISFYQARYNKELADENVARGKSPNKNITQGSQLHEIDRKSFSQVWVFASEAVSELRRSANKSSY